MKTSKTKQILFAIFFTIIAPGSYQFYRGKLVKGVILSVLSLLTVMLLYFSPLVFTRIGLFLGLAILFIVSVYILIDSLILAVRVSYTESGNYKPAFVASYIILIFFISMMLNYFSNIPIRMFTVATVSSSPNLKLGEIVAADFRLETKTNITYGDLVVFNYKNNPRIARVAAKQGDSVQFDELNVRVNELTLEKIFVKDTMFDNFHYQLFNETGFNKLKYQILKNSEPFNHAPYTSNKLVVPRGSYFLLADNRDISQDCRIIGSINQKDIVGKIVYRVISK